MNPSNAHNHALLKQNPWVISLQCTSSPMELMGLLITRILKPETVGPQIYPSFRMNALPLEILSKLIEDEILEAETIEALKESLKMLLELIMADKPITVSGITWAQMPEDQKRAILLNLFESFWYFRENNSALPLLLRWIEQNRNYLTTDDPQWRAVYASGLEAIYLLQNSDNHLETFWLGILKDGHSDYWKNAVVGLAELDVQATLELLPELIRKGLPKLGLTLSTLYISKTSGFQHSLVSKLKKALDAEEYWAALAINALGSELDRKFERPGLLFYLKTVNQAN